MKTTFAVMMYVLMLLFSACSPKINDPADVQAVKKSIDDYAKAVNAGDANGVAGVMADKAIYADLNSPVAVGREAIRSQTAAFNNLFKFEFTCPVEDVRVAGDLAVARGTWTVQLTPKAQGVAPIRDRGSWIVVFARQNDGTWKWDWCVPNSNQPLPGTTVDGAEEKALIQIEQDGANALMKSDLAQFEKFLAKEFTYNADGQIISRAQMAAEMRSGAYKFESAEMRDLSPHVFGDVAIVTMTAVIKGKYRGAEIPSPQKSTDFFVKRDGKWQIIYTQNVTVK
jgi:uncharacterized protein (TIGR02246 family)